MKTESTNYGISPITANTYSVVRVEPNKEWTKLYEFVPTLQEAYLLAQYAMNADRRSYEQLVVIMPGINKGLNESHPLYNKVKKLAKKYKKDK